MEALEIRESEADDAVLPQEIKDTNLKVAKVLNNIGCVNFESTSFDAAKDAFVDAIQLQKKTLGEVGSFSPTSQDAKTGLLTMASTLCNHAYIDLEQSSYKSAIATLNESLKIQKMLLGADNKLVLSTLENLGFAYTMLGSYDKALAVSSANSFPIK
jgi:tetratricopeptide (TPR) repeat protein